MLNLVERLGPLAHLAVVHTRRQETAAQGFIGVLVVPVSPTA